ncbi:lipopolysaccharide biosynthesis protein [Litorimonas sp. RW-G-Af-16]|uniref:lipopolysaccharide biosynthesis protein n=1 Tax=Litorimonas sp. RW-G-Af-16 TaxID=3241168 RepID=UPI00390C7611
MTADLSIYSRHTVGKRIAANTGLLVGAKIMGALMGLGSLLVATKYLSPVDLGVILFIHAYMLFFSEVATFQSWQSIIRFGTDDLKRKDVTRLAELLNFSFKVDAISAVFGFVLSLLVFGLIGWFVQILPDIFPQAGETNFATIQRYTGFYCILLLFRQLGTSTGIFRLFDKFRVLAVEGIIMPATRFIGVVLAAYFDAGFEGFLMAWFAGSLASYIYLPVMGALELSKRNLLRPVWQAKASLRRPRRGLWPFMVKSSIDSTLAAANLHLPALMVMGVFGAAWVAVFRIAEEVAKLLSEGFKLLDQVIYPELAKLISHGEAEKIWRLVTRTALILLGFGLTMSLFVMWVGPSLLGHLFSEEYKLAAPLTSLLVPAAALLGTAAPLYPVLYATDKPERAIYARGAGVIVYIVSFLGLSFTIGRMAPGWAAVLGNAFAVIILVYLARRTLNKTVNTQKQNAL